MTINNKTNATSQEIALYCLIGEAMCMIQYLEGALSTLITLKKDVRYPHRVTKKEADNLLEKYRSSYTLGRAIKCAKENALFSDDLHKDLDELLQERNWLTHKLIIYHLDDMYTASTRDILFHRIKAIANKSKTLQIAIEVNLIKFSESVGLDMSRVRAYMKQYSTSV